MSPAEIIENLRGYYASYHDHKENMAYAATTVYIGAATAVILNSRELLSHAHPRCIFATLLVLAFVFGHAFIIWQLANREVAASILHSATAVLLTLAVPGAPTPDMTPSVWCQQPLPKVLVEHLQTPTARGFLGGPRTATLLTIGATFLWSLLALWALVC